MRRDHAWDHDDWEDNHGTRQTAQGSSHARRPSDDVASDPRRQVHHHSGGRDRDDGRDQEASKRRKFDVDDRSRMSSRTGEDTRKEVDHGWQRRRETDRERQKETTDERDGSGVPSRHSTVVQSARLPGRGRDDSSSSDERDPQGSRFQSVDRRRVSSRHEDGQDAWRDRDERGTRSRESGWRGGRDRERRDALHSPATEHRQATVRGGRPFSRNEDDFPGSNIKHVDSSSRLQSTVKRSTASKSDEEEHTPKGKDVRKTWKREPDRSRERGDVRDAPVPELHSIHKATVQSVRPFGLFVRMDGYRNHGLVHVSQISDHEVTKRDDSDAAKVEAISSVVGESEQVWVKVISVKAEDDGSVKIGCSLKYVSQDDGTDLDPNNVKLERLQSKPVWQAPQKLQLDAVYNVTCTRCGGHGHLKKECYSAGDKTYELLQDEDDNCHGTGVLAGAEPMPKMLSEVGQSSKPPSGPAGRGRAMVQPAWMKHGVGGNEENVLGRCASAGVGDGDKDRSYLPEKVTTVEEALAVLAKLKEEKRRRKEEKKIRKHHRREKKHETKESKREKRRKGHRSEDDRKSKKHRV